MSNQQLQYATLEAIAPRVEELITDHEADRGSLENLWMPSDFQGKFRKDALIPEQALVALVYNTLTEDGLPSFHRLIATYLGGNAAWTKWNGMWTAEESRHGRALSAYLSQLSQVRMRRYDEMLFTYHVAGFYPAWEANPYRLLAYTVMQERATQISHVGVARLVNKHDPTLGQMLGKIAREEDRHCRFYTEVFRLVLELDAPGALKALAEEIRSFAMPGTSIPGFAYYVQLAERSGVFGVMDFKSIVESVIKKFSLKDLHLMDTRAEASRQEILKFPKLLARAARTVDANARILQFPFLEANTVML